MTITTATFPPVYRVAPYTLDTTEGFYSRIRPYSVSMEQVDDLIVTKTEMDEFGYFSFQVEILGEDIDVYNPSFENSDGIHPIYFEVPGAAYHYTVAIWRDRVEVDVCRLGSFEVLSTMFPKTKLEFRLALDTIVRDYQAAEALAA